jgi:hypothetical protein
MTNCRIAKRSPASGQADLFFDTIYADGGNDVLNAGAGLDTVNIQSGTFDQVTLGTGSAARSACASCKPCATARSSQSRARSASRSPANPRAK